MSSGSCAVFHDPDMSALMRIKSACSKASGADPAEGGGGNRAQPFIGNRVTAFDADTICPGLDPPQRGVDAVQFIKVGIAKRFEHLVALPFRGAVLPILWHRIVERLLDPAKLPGDLGAAFLKQVFLVVQVHDGSPFDPVILPGQTGLHIDVAQVRL